MCLQAVDNTHKLGFAKPLCSQCLYDYCLCFVCQQLVNTLEAHVVSNVFIDFVVQKKKRNHFETYGFGNCTLCVFFVFFVFLGRPSQRSGPAKL